MKLKTLLLIVAALSLQIAQANSSDSLRKRFTNDDETLLGKGRPLGFFVAWQNKPMLLNEQAAWMTGGQISLVFGRKLNVGFAGYGLVSPVKSDRLDANGYRMYFDMGYGGLILEPVLFTRKMIHLTIPVLLGGGGVGFRQGYDPYDPQWEDIDWDNYNGDAFFIAEPGLNLELNLFKWMRFHAGASYRFATDGYFGSSLSGQLSGWSANFGLKLGWF